MDDSNGKKDTFEWFEARSRESCLQCVTFSFGPIQPIDKVKKPSIAGMYNMLKWPHGICLIINNEKFKPHPEHNLEQ